MRKIFGLGLLFLNGMITSQTDSFQVQKRLCSIAAHFLKTYCAGMFPVASNSSTARRK